MKLALRNIAFSFSIVALFFILFSVLLVFVRHLFPTFVLIRGGSIVIAGIFLLGLIFLAVMFGRRKITGNILAQVFIALVLGAVASYAFLIAFPALVDRSLTVYLLSTISNSNNGLTNSELHDVASNGWWPAVDQVGRRISEESALGLIRQNSTGQYVITGLGEVSVWFFRLVQQVFALDPTMVVR